MRNSLLVLFAVNSLRLEHTSRLAIFLTCLPTSKTRGGIANRGVRDAI